MIKGYHSLYSRIMISLTGLILFSLICLSLFFGYWMKNRLVSLLDENSKNILESTSLNIETVYRNINHFEESMISRRKTEIRNNTIIAYSILENARKLYENGIQKEEESKKQLTSCLENLKFDEPGGYFWLTDDQLPFPSMIMHPVQTELNGKILDSPEFDTAMGNESNLFSAMVKTALENGEGYVEYLWPKPDSDNPEKMYRKIGYVNILNPGI